MAMSADPRAEVQRVQPYGRIAPRRIVPLPVDAVHPVIRIVHRLFGRLDVRERIIVDHELVMILSGRGELRFGTNAIVYEPHTLLFIPPFVPHSFHDMDGHSVEHLAVHFDFAPNTPPQDEELSDRNPYEVRLSSGIEIPFRTPLAPGHRIERALLEVLKARDSGEPTGGLAAIAYLTEALVLLMRHETGKANEAVSVSQRVKVTRALQYVDTHLAAPMNAQHLADAADLSVSRFNTLFKLETGYAPAEYIRRRRVDEARRLLSEPDLSVKEIAARTGFEDSFHFSKVFRKIDGLSPTRYREAVLAGRPKS
jgi:AraC-like DNA-binding protein